MLGIMHTLRDLVFNMVLGGGSMTVKQKPIKLGPVSHSVFRTVKRLEIISGKPWKPPMSTSLNAGERIFLSFYENCDRLITLILYYCSQLYSS